MEYLAQWKAMLHTFEIEATVSALRVQLLEKGVALLNCKAKNNCGDAYTNKFFDGFDIRAIYTCMGS
jgi:hypothetical protein